MAEGLKEPGHTLEKLNPAEDLTLRIVAKNEFGPSEPSEEALVPSRASK